jgi:hypothetical protein
MDVACSPDPAYIERIVASRLQSSHILSWQI